MSAGTATRLGRGSRVAVRMFAVLGLLSLSLMPLSVTMEIAGGQDRVLVPPGSEEAVYGAEHPGEDVHVVGSVALLVLGAVGLLTLVVRPEHAGAATHAAAVATAMVAATILAGNPDNHGGQAGPVDVALLGLSVPPLVAALAARPWHEWRVAHLRRRPLLSALAALGVAAVPFGVAQSLLQRNTWPPLADPHHQAHWVVMGAAALAAVAAVGAATAGRGWRLTYAVAGAAAVGAGIASLSAPAAASALAPPAAVAAIGWGLLVAGAAHRRP